MHAFFSLPNIAIFTALAAAMSADGASTQWFLSPEVEARHGNNIIEANPIARPFVKKGVAGQAFISGLGFAAIVGTSFISHHYGNHFIERAIPIAVAAISGFLAWRNYQL